MIESVMKKIGLFYGAKANKTALIAKKIKEEFGENIESIMIENAWGKDFEKFDNLIIGTSTWFDGELPTYWDEIIPELCTLNLKNKKVAIFGLGDQINYPENFVDGIGILAEALEGVGAKIIGVTSVEGYHFENSRALKDGKLLGLVIDVENQPEKTDERIREWCKKLKTEFA